MAAAHLAVEASVRSRSSDCCQLSVLFVLTAAVGYVSRVVGLRLVERTNAGRDVQPLCPSDLCNPLLEWVSDVELLYFLRARWYQERIPC